MKIDIIHSDKITPHVRQFAIEGWYDLANGLGGARGGWNNITVDTSTTAPILIRGAVDGLLRRGRGVHGRHQTFNDAVVVVDDLGKGSETVGRAGSVRDLVFSKLNYLCEKG